MRIIKILMISVLLLSIISCEDLTEINQNPNNVSETHPQLLLTQIEASAFAVHGKSPLNATRMLVTTDGESSEQYYKWNRASFDDYNALRNITKMQEEGKRVKSDAYVAIANFFRAYYFYQLSLKFGDIPYSEALGGERNQVYKPKYDTQKDVFIGILKELEEANKLLISSKEIVQGDIIYGGDTEKWRKLVNSFRLKVLLTLSKKEGDASLKIKDTFAKIYKDEPIISSLADNAQITFLDQAGSRYSEFNSSSYGSGTYMASTFVDMLKERKDPRLFLFASITKTAKESGTAISDFSAYSGGDPILPYADVNEQATKGGVSKVNDRYTTNPTTEPHNILSYWEVSFILAEAAVRGWISVQAKDKYADGVKASFKFYSSYAKDYAKYLDAAAVTKYLAGDLVAFDKATSKEDKIKLIITQKYFTTFLQGGWSAFFENLRTTYPTFPTVAGVTVPTRWMYPNSEYQENTENVAKAIETQFGRGNDKTRVKTWWLK